MWSTCLHIHVWLPLGGHSIFLFFILNAGELSISSFSGKEEQAILNQSGFSVADSGHKFSSRDNSHILIGSLLVAAHVFVPCESRVPI